MSDRPIFTYQTRLALTPDQAAILDAYATLYGQAERRLFAAIQSGGTLNDLKRDFLPRFGLSARQFNALRVGLDGKIASIKERQPERIAEAESRIRQAAKVVARLESKTPGTSKLHQKKRRLISLQDRLSALKADQEAGTIRLCFGGKKLFRAQFDLDANGYADPGEWKSAWQQSRSRQFFVLGSQDETAGNQSCQATVVEAGTLALQLRLPNDLAAQGKHLALTGVCFAYGHAQIVAALASSQRIHGQTQGGQPIVKRIGTALSYRFVRDAKGWRLFVSTEARPAERVSHRALGAIGVDVNADPLAVSETDRFGNLIGTQRLNLNLYGQTQHQARALVGHVTFALPVRNRAKQLWSFWSKVRTRLKAAHAAHFRCGAHQFAPPPLSPARPGVCAPWTSTARPRGANRSQHGSESVESDVPF